MKSTKQTLSPYAKFAALSDAEKEAVYDECDDPKIALRARPMSARMRKLWERAKRKGGRPRIGKGAARVLISIEKGLLEDADAFAQRRRMSRSELFSRGVRAVLAKAG
jgi:hypothetical protein